MTWPKDPGQRYRAYRLLRERDGDSCAICREPINFGLRKTNHPRAPSIDHFVPRSAGGSNRLPNLRLTHRGCNTDRQSAGWLPVAAKESA